MQSIVTRFAILVLIWQQKFYLELSTEIGVFFSSFVHIAYEKKINILYNISLKVLISHY